jgi:hypothetical protein
VKYQSQAETRSKQETRAKTNNDEPGSTKKKAPGDGRSVLEDALKMLASNQNVPLGDAEPLPTDDDLGDYPQIERV